MSFQTKLFKKTAIVASFGMLGCESADGLRANFERKPSVGTWLIRPAAFAPAKTVDQVVDEFNKQLDDFKKNLKDFKEGNDQFTVEQLKKEVDEAKADTDEEEEVKNKIKDYKKKRDDLKIFTSDKEFKLTAFTKAGENLRKEMMDEKEHPIAYRLANTDKKSLDRKVFDNWEKKFHLLDVIKAFKNDCTKYIGFGDSSTGAYKEFVGEELANLSEDGDYNATDVVYVSANGAVGNPEKEEQRVKVLKSVTKEDVEMKVPRELSDEYKAPMVAAMKAGATFVADGKQRRKTYRDNENSSCEELNPYYPDNTNKNRTYRDDGVDKEVVNIVGGVVLASGEQELAYFLCQNGYVETPINSGVWKKNTYWNRFWAAVSGFNFPCIGSRC